MSESCASGQAGVLLFSPQRAPAPGPLRPPLELVVPQHNFPLYHFLPKDAVVARIICTALTSLPKSLHQGLLHALMLLLAWKVPQGRSNTTRPRNNREPCCLGTVQSSQAHC